MGPPGAGKGTQAKRLVERFGLAHLSSGDIFRAERASGSALGRKLAEYMDAGKLVPDETVVDVMASAIAKNSAGAGLLLDGFPRTVPQAEALDRQLDRIGKPLDAVMVIAAEDDLIVDRVTGRRGCPKCGKVYHVRNIPPKTEGVCDGCGTALVHRGDDTEKLVRQRLAAYRRQTAPVVAYYRARPGLKLVEADGNKDAGEVYDALAAAVRGLAARK
jgi:adenylate kinase